MNDTEIDCTALFAAPGFDPWDCCNSVASTLYLSDGKLFWSCAQ